jgi:hypothetical protein
VESKLPAMANMDTREGFWMALSRAMDMGWDHAQERVELGVNDHAGAAPSRITGAVIAERCRIIADRPMQRGVLRDVYATAYRTKATIDQWNGRSEE